MPVIEPNVTKDKLVQLLDEGAESETLDFKETCDLSSKSGQAGDPAAAAGGGGGQAGVAVVAGTGRGLVAAGLPSGSGDAGVAPDELSVAVPPGCRRPAGWSHRQTT